VERQERAVPEIELMRDCRAIIGESPTWIAPERALYWKDAFFLSHSHAGEVLRAPYDRASGSLGKPSPFAEIRTGGHVPDGAAGDEDVCFWCAVHGGGVLHRYDPSGGLIARVELPISQPTMCAFAGPELDEMVVTSASDKLTKDQLKREPHAGGLFRLRPGIRGLPRPCVVR
jgi:sugar lactone lactonase YvrE